MSNLGRRFKYYGLGFGMGTLFVIFFFNNRGCTWTPSNRVKTSITERAIVLPDSQKEALKKKNIQPEDLRAFVEEADIDFGASNKTKENKFYQLTTDKTTLFFTLTNESFITSVFTKRPLAADWKKGKAEIISFPEGEDLIYTDTSGTQQRIRTELGFKNDRKVLAQMKEKCFVNYEKSDFLNSIKPEHYLQFLSKNGDTIGAISVWYKEKINVSNYIISDSLK